MQPTHLIGMAKLSNDTTVIVTRNHVGGYDPRSPNGYTSEPKTISQAVQDGDLATNQGTMRASIVVADGQEWAGYSVSKIDGSYYVNTEQFDHKTYTSAD